MKIGTRLNRHWLKSENDEDLRFLKQIGVDCLSISVDVLKGSEKKDAFGIKDLPQLVNRLDAFNLKIGRASVSGPEIDGIHLGAPGSHKQIENICRIMEVLGQAKIPVLAIRCLWAEALVEKQNRPGWVNRQGHRGYTYPAFSFDVLRSISYEPVVRTTADELWNNLINLYRQVMPEAEKAGVKLAMHGNDPPIYQACGNPQILCRFADFDRLFSEVPGPNNGMVFCVGTRYESGEDIFQGIRHFGQQGKIFYVDFRNVRGTLPSKGGYEEVYVDDGDINMAEVINALHEAGYEGVIDLDHMRLVSGDTLLGHRYIAFVAGYMKGLLAHL